MSICDGCGKVCETPVALGRTLLCEECALAGGRAAQLARAGRLGLSPATCGDSSPLRTTCVLGRGHDTHEDADGARWPALRRPGAAARGRHARPAAPAAPEDDPGSWPVSVGVEYDDNGPQVLCQAWRELTPGRGMAGGAHICGDGLTGSTLDELKASLVDHLAHVPHVGSPFAFAQPRGRAGV